MNRKRRKDTEKAIKMSGHLWENVKIGIMYYQHDHDVLKEATVVWMVFDGDITSYDGGCDREVKYITLLSYGIIKMTLVVYLLLCISDEWMELSLSGQIKGSNPNAFGFFSPKNAERRHWATIFDYLFFLWCYYDYEDEKDYCISTCIVNG